MAVGLPLASFVGPDGDRFELFERGQGDDLPGEAVAPFVAAWVVRGFAWLDDGARILPFGQPLDDRDALADDLERGPTSRFVLRRHPRPRPTVVIDDVEEAPTLTDLLPVRAPPRTELVSFEMRIVDEMGEPVDGIRVRFTVDGVVRSVATDGDGRIRADDGTGSFASAKIDDIAQLRDALRPRWETIREGDWQGEELHHSYIDCREPLPIVSLEAETLHTVVVQPRVVCARLVGMFFDTSKSFLLPSALAEIKTVRSIYEDRPDADVLIVGHTDTAGQPSYNDPLSLERADAVRAYLRDDVDAWLEWYGSSKSWEKRWGSREDNLMLTAILAEDGQPVTDTPMRHFQATRGLSVDGVAGPQTRRQLVTEYMGFDDTTLPEGIDPTVHGCGENFPMEEGGEGLDDAPADGDEDIEDRRVELFFFDGELGVLPPPPGDNSPPGSPEYPEWRRRARETHDVKQGAHRLAAVRVCDEKREPIANAPVRYPATGLTAIADDEGFIELDEGVAGEACDIEWTKPGQESFEPWPFRLRVFVQFPPGEKGSRRKLHNVGYPIPDDLEASVLGYQMDFDFEPSGVLAHIEPSLHAWHDGGETPDPNNPNPPPPGGGGDPTKETQGGNKKATAKTAESTKLLVGVSAKGVTKAKPLPKSEVSVDVVVTTTGTTLSPNKVLVDHAGGLVFQFLDVPNKTVDITARRKQDGELVSIATKRGHKVNTTKVHDAVSLSLGPPASFASIDDSAAKYGFDTFTDSGFPRMTVEEGKTDTVVVDITPPGTFAQCAFVTDNGNATLTPKFATGDATTLTIKGVSNGGTKVNVVRDGETIGRLFVKTMKRQKKTVGVRLVHATEWNAPDVSIADVQTKLNEIYDQVMVSWEVTRLPTMTVDFDLNKDGTMNTQGFDNPEEHVVIEKCKDDSFDFNLFIVARPDDGKTRGHMGISNPYGFVFSDITNDAPRTAAHELGHGLGFAHVDDLAGPMKNDINNLMFSTSEHGGVELRHFQWEQV